MAVILGRAPGGPVSSINVTPMADVMIVLLIIFMVVVPVLHRTDGLQLPAVSSTREQQEGPVVILVKGDRTTFVGAERVLNLGELLLLVQQRLDAVPGPARTVYIRADQGLPYAEVEKIMEVCREAGAEQVALVACPRGSPAGPCPTR